MTLGGLLVPSLGCHFVSLMPRQKHGRKSYPHRPGLNVRLNLSEVPKSQEKFLLDLGHYSVWKSGIWIGRVGAEYNCEKLRQRTATRESPFEPQSLARGSGVGPFWIAVVHLVPVFCLNPVLNPVSRI